MAALLSHEWMEEFARAWNADDSIVSKLSSANFSSVIGYGFLGEDRPRGVITVEDGKVIDASRYTQQQLNWDLRASMASWQTWIANGFGLASLGTAVSTGKLRFVVGDYRQMVRNARLAGPFLRHFELMQQVKTDFVFA